MEGIQISEYWVGYDDDIVYLKVNGYIDTSTSIELVNWLKNVIDKGYVQFVVDLSGVNYVSSAGWGVFVGEIRTLQEKGGNIKLVNMTPEVYDVFQMLEFDKILQTNDSVEEAINEFDLMRGFDITTTPVKELQNQAEETTTVPDIQVSQISAEKKISRNNSDELWTKKHSDVSLLPLTEKIKHVVTQNPLISIWGIKKELNSENYGQTKVGLIRLHRLLKELNLGTKEQRYRFYRSR